MGHKHDATANLADAFTAETAARKAIYEDEHQGTRHGGDRKSSRQLGDLNVDRFTADTAAKTGRSERSIQRDAERGKKIDEDVLVMLTPHKVSGTILDQLKRMPVEQQRRPSPRRKERRPWWRGERQARKAQGRERPRGCLPLAGRPVVLRQPDAKPERQPAPHTAPPAGHAPARSGRPRQARDHVHLRRGDRR